ncbi:Hypp839 [Branchiostoma lanceolatum]|uniref:Hypp839 protein n=1 Tax=Branchiostoma lanceolatum TaxID=7740 RepID=A0A8J9YKJ3_BRALA|nr:Hypp839 [Branchiostoma lanceolatum]
MEVPYLGRATPRALILRAVPCGSGAAASGLPHHEVLDENGDFVLSWTFDDEQIESEARVKTRGCVGLGLSLNGGMPGSDIAIGCVKNGQAYRCTR